MPLHWGKCPPWLYEKMKSLANAIIAYIYDEYGEEEIIRRVSNPFWFQSLSNLLGFDWHSSGTTTTTTAALKEAINKLDNIAMAGGKGKAALRTPEEIERFSPKVDRSSEELIKASKLIAKVDTALIQDGYSLYHHTFIFTNKSIAVIQQGMNAKERKARRYHWYNPSGFLRGEEEIVGFRERQALNLVGKEKERLRKAMVEIALEFPQRHNIRLRDLSARSLAFFSLVKEYAPSTMEELLLLRGSGPKVVRALALTASLIYGEELDWRDPVKYAFAHGGKDGIPFPVDKQLYTSTIESLKEALENSKAPSSLKRKGLRILYSKLFSQSTLRDYLA